MARTDAYSIFQANGTDEELLAEKIALFTRDMAKAPISSMLKNMDGEGEPAAGSVEYKRPLDVGVENYGTARTAGEADKIAVNPVTVNLDQRKEIVEEVYEADLAQYGVPGLLERRAQKFVSKMQRSLDTAFFAEAVSGGTEKTVTGTDITDKLEALIVLLEETSNSYVDGIDRAEMVLTLKPSAYSALRSHVDTLPNPADGGVRANLYHDVAVMPNHRQTKDAVLQVVGSIAMPVWIRDIGLDKIPLSADFALSLFFNYGVKTIAPDLVLYADLDETPSA